MTTYPEFLREWREGTGGIKCRTSGSTGVPKDIVLPRDVVTASAYRTIEFFGLSSESHLHSCISPDYIGGKMMAVRSELCGGTLSWEHPSSEALEKFRTHFPDYPDEFHLDLVSVVPTQLWHITDHCLEMPWLGDILAGGAPLPLELRKKIRDSGLRVWETYGMTETASHVALRNTAKNQGGFKPLPGIKIGIDKTGRIVVSGATGEDIVTNDIGEWICDGEFRILGRYDNVIITGGKKVHPEILEEFAEKFLAEKKCSNAGVLIYGEPDKKWGSRVCCMIELAGKRSYSETEREMLAIELAQACKEHLGEEYSPKKTEFGRLPRTANGKKKRGRGFV